MLNNEATDIQRPKPLHALLEARTLLELGLTSVSLPYLLSAPKGDKHPVMVLPGFLAGDLSTKPLRVYLNKMGYNAYGWNCGPNLGQEIEGTRHIVSKRLLHRVLDLCEQHGSTISLVGWSLGGILAREIARTLPDQVRQVISLGSPFQSPEGAAPIASKLFKLLNGDIVEQHQIMAKRLIKPPPVPSTAIFSRTDGVAHWTACMDNIPSHDSQTENIEVYGSHMGLGHNPSVIWLIANRLAQPEGEWQPIDQNSLPKSLFPDPYRD